MLWRFFSANKQAKMRWRSAFGLWPVKRSLSCRFVCAARRAPSDDGCFKCGPLWDRPQTGGIGGGSGGGSGEDDDGSGTKRGRSSANAALTRFEPLELLSLLFPEEETRIIELMLEGSNDEPLSAIENLVGNEAI